MELSQIFWLLAIGLAGGLLSGLFGVGGGIVIVPALVYFLSMSQKSAQGTSLAIMLVPLSFAAAVYNYHKAGNVNFKFAAVILVTFIIGSIVGSRFAMSLNSEYLRKGFGILMIIAAVKMILK